MWNVSLQQCLNDKWGVFDVLLVHKVAVPFGHSSLCMKGNGRFLFYVVITFCKMWPLFFLSYTGKTSRENVRHFNLVPVFVIFKRNILICSVRSCFQPMTRDYMIDINLPQLPLTMLGKHVLFHPRWHVCKVVYCHEQLELQLHFLLPRSSWCALL